LTGERACNGWANRSWGAVIDRRSTIKSSVSALAPARACMAEPPAAHAKISLLFCAVGDAPILSTRVVTIDASSRFAVVSRYLCRVLGRDTIFCFLHSSFAPSLDDTVGSLASAFGSEQGSKLAVHYALTQAWG